LTVGIRLEGLSERDQLAVSEALLFALSVQERFGASGVAVALLVKDLLEIEGVDELHYVLLVIWSSLSLPLTVLYLHDVDIKLFFPETALWRIFI